jgi:hypothetical protein
LNRFFNPSRTGAINRGESGGLKATELGENRPQQSIKLFEKSFEVTKKKRRSKRDNKKN